ncbi:hypothetical protein LAZ67_1003019 [Cordylochernes scorpioides]|uniref:Mariner Mos1 transposase n=1 Tax=Cordylochernes scorpioides TaxID=51811 RepID=A0ABY6JY63_9ARAC|nr:hypothetical protein LAZ67_1003019 [Cordylochernes scorpioides]
MLITFFDSRGIIHKEFVPAGQTITGEYYLNVLKQYRDEDSWCLLHDNAPSHSSLTVRRFLAKNNVCVLNHPPYSPDLAQCDFYLFPKIKLKLKDKVFAPQFHTEEVIIDAQDGVIFQPEDPVALKVTGDNGEDFPRPDGRTSTDGALLLCVEVKKWIDEWIAAKELIFFHDGIRHLPERWRNVMASDGKYFEH